MQKPSSCWKGSTDHWWCDVTFRCDSSWIHLKKSHRQSHKQCWGLACRRSGVSLSYTGKSDQLYPIISTIIKHHPTSIRSISDRVPEPKIDLWRYSEYGESIGEYYSEKPFFRWFLINGFPMILLVSDIFRSCFHHWCFHMFSYEAPCSLGAWRCWARPSCCLVWLEPKDPCFRHVVMCCDVLWCVVMCCDVGKPRL